MDSFSQGFLNAMETLFQGIAETFKYLYVHLFDRYSIVTVFCVGVFCIILLVFCGCMIIDRLRK